jgi:hypothetical protein
MTISAQPFRPLFTAPDLSWVRRVNWAWLLRRSPMFVLALLSSWGVGGFIHMVAPLPVAILGSGAFDLVFLGAIALADQQLDHDVWSKVNYWALNAGAAALAALLNTLYYAGGEYRFITWEAATHGVPFALFGLLYSLYYHTIMSRAIERDIRQAAQQEALLLSQQYACPYGCGWVPTGKPDARRMQAAMHGHKGRCPKRPTP